jgi:hypothetical protein
MTGSAGSEQNSVASSCKRNTLMKFKKSHKLREISWPAGPLLSSQKYLLVVIFNDLLNQSVSHQQPILQKNEVFAII